MEEEHSNDPESIATESIANARRIEKRLRQRSFDGTDKQQDISFWLEYYSPEDVEDELTKVCKDRFVLLHQHPELLELSKDPKSVDPDDGIVRGHPRGYHLYELDFAIEVLKAVRERQRSKQPETNDVPSVIGNGTLPSSATRTRGRPDKLPDDAKRRALVAKDNGSQGKEVAAILYATQYPTRRQITDARNVLKNYQKRQRSETNKP